MERKSLEMQAQPQNIGRNPAKAPRRVGSLSKHESALLEKLYAKGPAAFGSKVRLQKQSGLKKSQIDEFLHSNDSYTKYRSPRQKFPRLKVIAFRINEIWSLDLADVSKLQSYNKGTRFLLVAVDVLSRYVRVEPLKDKTAKTTALAFAKMIKTKTPEKVWTDKGGEFKGAFKTLCDKKGIDYYTTQSEMKSAFAERNIRSLKNILYKYLEKYWTYSYLLQLPEFVKTINTRVNRVTGLAPYKVTKKDTAHLVSLTNVNRARRPRFVVGDIVRIAKADIPFRKGYKANFTDELFDIVKISTLNPPTYNLRDSSGEIILGKFYEPELSKVNGKI